MTKQFILFIYPTEIKRKEVKLRFERVKKVLGFEIDHIKIKEIFNSLELEVIEETKESITCSIPLFRHDIEREIDLIEEVSRILGLDNIPVAESLKIPLQSNIDERTIFERKQKNLLSGLGFCEIWTNSLDNPEEDKKLFYYRKKGDFNSHLNLVEAYPCCLLIKETLNLGKRPSSSVWIEGLPLEGGIGSIDLIVNVLEVLFDPKFLIDFYG